MTPASGDFYSPREIAAATGVPEADVVAALGGVRQLVGHADAVRIGRHLAAAARRNARLAESAAVVSSAPKADGPLFSLFSEASRSRRSAGVPLALSSTLHAGLIGFAVVLATFNLSPRAASLADDRPAEPMRLVFIATPGPGGGGGGGGFARKRRRRRRFAKGAARSAARCRCAASRSQSSRRRRRRNRSPNR